MSAAAPEPPPRWRSELIKALPPIVVAAGWAGLAAFVQGLPTWVHVALTVLFLLSVLLVLWTRGQQFVLGGLQRVASVRLISRQRVEALVAAASSPQSPAVRPAPVGQSMLVRNLRQQLTDAQDALKDAELQVTALRRDALDAHARYVTELKSLRAAGLESSLASPAPHRELADPSSRRLYDLGYHVGRAEAREEAAQALAGIDTVAAGYVSPAPRWSVEQGTGDEWLLRNTVPETICTRIRIDTQPDQFTITDSAAWPLLTGAMALHFHGALTHSDLTEGVVFTVSWWNTEGREQLIRIARPVV